MKFLPPEDEIRAQLRELTSQTRRLRADLQGMITRRGPSQRAFSHDKRYRLNPEPSAEVRGEEVRGEPAHEAGPKEARSATPKSVRKGSPKKRR